PHRGQVGPADQGGAEMKSYLIAGLSGALVLLGCAAQAAAPPLIVEKPGEDTQDLLFLGEPRPALIRVHLRIDGKPYSQRWERCVRKLFRLLDKNGDGVLDKDEAKRLPPVVHLQQLLAGNPYLGLSTYYPRVSFNMLDTNLDGKITPDEFAHYYRSTT